MCVFCDTEKKLSSILEILETIPDVYAVPDQSISDVMNGVYDAQDAWRCMLHEEESDDD